MIKLRRQPTGAIASRRSQVFGAEFLSPKSQEGNVGLEKEAVWSSRMTRSFSYWRGKLSMIFQVDGEEDFLVLLIESR